LNCSGGIFDYDQKREQLEEVMLELENPDIWSNPEHAQQLGKEKASLETVVGGLDEGLQALVDATELLELAASEDDEATVVEVEVDLQAVEKTVAELEFRRMFSGEMDANNAYLDIQSGAGGTEAQDWAEMLLRMYLRWGESRGFKTELIEVSDGDVAGIKSATVRF
jgi:peptide chain release factor 2